MLAFNAFGTKEIVVYVIAIIVVIALLGWYLMRRRTKA
jgi:LPXTG-motif cell wall-anchored protein